MQVYSFCEYWLMRDGALIVAGCYPYGMKEHGGWSAVVAKIRVYPKEGGVRPAFYIISNL